MLDRLREAQARVADHYEIGDRSQRLYANPLLVIHRLRLARLVDMLDQGPGIATDQAVLDVGCGDLYVMCLLAEAGHVPGRYVGLDPAAEDPGGREFRSIAEQNAGRLRERHGIKVTLSHDPIERFSARTPFDTVLALETIEHVADEDAAIDAIAAHLAPGGDLILSVPVEHGPGFAIKEPLRMIAQRRIRYTLPEYLHATLGQPGNVERVEGTHKGYDHRATFQRLEGAGLKLREASTYPLDLDAIAYGVVSRWQKPR